MTIPSNTRSKFEVVDDDPNEDIHVRKMVLPDGEIGNIYVEIDNPELKKAIEMFDGVHHEKEKLSFFSNEEVALSIRDRLRSIDTKERILELANRKKPLVLEMEELERLANEVDLDDFPILKLNERKQDIERRLEEIEQEFEKLIARS